MINKIIDFFTLNIKRQLITGVVVVHGILMSIFILDIAKKQETFVLQESVNHAETMVYTLARNSALWVLSNDYVGMEELLKSVKKYPSLEYAMLITDKGKVLAHTNPKYINKYLSDDLSLKFLQNKDISFIVKNNHLIDIAAPIFSDNKTNNKIVGWARIGVNQNNLNDNIFYISVRGAMYALIAIIVGWIFAFLLANTIAKKIFKILTLSKNITNGHWSDRIHIDNKDELGELAQQFNLMLDTIEDEKNNVQKEKTKLQIATSSSEIGVWTWNLKTNVLDWDENMYNIFDVDSSDKSILLYETWSTSLHKEDKESAENELFEALNNNAKFDTQFRIITPLNNLKTIKATGVVYYENDEPAYMIGTNQDISESVLMYEKLEREYKNVDEQNEELLLIEKELQLRVRENEVLFENASVAYFLLSENYEIIKSNIQAKTEFNLALTQSFQSILETSSKELFHTYITNKEFLSQPLTIKMNKLNGEIGTYKVVVNINPECENEYLVSIVSIDSEIRLLEEIQKTHTLDMQLIEQAKLAQMGEMIGNIAHQWRQPLSMISIAATGMIFKQEEGVLDFEHISDELEIINEQAQYLSHTIDTFRNYLLEKKEKQKVVIQDRIELAFKIIEINFKNNFIELRHNIHELEPISYELVAGELIQILLNILNNAKDVLNEREIENKWVELKLSKDTQYITITIEDNGGGIPENIIGRIFEPYFTTKHQSQGTGLGLYMSRNIILNSFNGNIQVENTDNGAMFIISLPVQKES